jgi:hypothetical protein
MKCPACQTFNPIDDPDNAFGAIYSCKKDDHVFYYRHDYNFIILIPETKFLLAQNDYGTSIYYNTYLSDHVTLEKMHYSDSWIQLQRVLKIKSLL